ncbi:MAG TPA: hypothetical protein PLV92_03470, partial [Pirellulaceae bacterium]|nr:hypothetical protein [Pirellulaceae bacterium]
AGRPIPAPDDKSLLVASLSLTLGDFEYQAPGYSGGIAGLAPGQNFWTYESTTHVDAVLQADLRNQPSGIFAYNMNAGFMRGDQNGFTGSLSATPGELISVNSIASPFGAGWSIAGWQSIAEQADGRVLLIDGDGSELKFTPGALPGTYQSPTGDFSTLEKVAGVFRRTLVDKTVYQFNAANQLATITDRHGNVTTFQYTSGRLTAVVDPVGLSTAFTYTGARVTQITDPAGRGTLLAYDSAGNLLSVTDPDGARRTWTYDGDRHMISETDQLGRREETLYGFHGRAIGGLTKDGSRIQVDALQTQGLLPISKTSDPLHPGSTVTITGNSANYAEQGAAVSQTPLDSKGQSQTDRDRYGLLGTVGRDANNLPTFELDGRGHATLYQYDSLGNMVSRRDELSGGGEVIGSISPEGEVDRYTFAGHAGQMLYVDGPSGSFNAGLRITDSNDTFIFSIDRFFSGNYNVLPVAMLPNDGQYSLTVE